MKKNYRNPMTRPENFMNPAGNVMKEIKGFKQFFRRCW